MSTHRKFRRVLTSAGITTIACVFIIGGISYVTGGHNIRSVGESLLATGLTLALLLATAFYTSGRSRARLLLQIPLAEKTRPVDDPYYDAFAGVLLSTVLVAVLGLVTIIAANARAPLAATPDTLPFIGSVRAALPTIEAKALQWQSDAYLDQLTYAFGLQDTFVIRAWFSSPSDWSKRLLVEVSPDRTVVQSLRDRSGLHPKIESNSWPIDSNQAIELFAKDPLVRECVNYPSDRVKELHLLYFYDESPSARWCLFVEGCPVFLGCLDAAVGEINS